MGSVESYATAKGKRYRVRYRDPDRKQRDKWGFATKREAEQFLAAVEVSKARGEYIDTSAARETISALGAVWLANQAHLKPSSYRPVEIAWRKHVEPVWGDRRVGEIRHSDVQSWVTAFAAGDRKPRSATTVLRCFGVLASILDVAVKDRRILANPARGVNLPRKQTQQKVYLSHEQVVGLAKASGDKAAFVLVLAYCGLRWGEAVGLRVRDLDMLRRRINVNRNAVEVGDRIEVGSPKSHKARSVPFPATLTVPLARLCEGKGMDDLVFTGPEGGFMRRTRTDDSSRGWFSQAVREAGLERLTPHALRHTAASLAVSSGANVKAVQRMLGHASASMTLDVYADLFDDDLDAVATRLDEQLARTVVGELWGKSAQQTKATP